MTPISNRRGAAALLVAAIAFVSAACGVASDDGSASDSSDLTANAFPTGAAMFGQLVGYTGAKVGDPGDESFYEQATGRPNYGVGAAATPFFEDQKLGKDALATRRTAVRAALWKALVAQAGDPRTPPVPSWKTGVTFVTPLQQKATTGNGTPYTKQQFFFPSPLYGAKISGVILIPDSVTAAKSAPAVMYNHYHGGEYWTGTTEVDNSLTQDWNFPGHGSWGHYLLDQGYIVFAVDALGFNHRRIDGAARGCCDLNKTDDDVWDELGFAQFFAKHDGGSRFAARTYEDIFALRLLETHPLVDKSRISAIGMSMGCVRTWAMSALVGEQLASAVALGTFPRWQDVARVGNQRAHRNAHFFTGQISDMKLDTESFILAASSTHLLAIMGDSADDPQDGVVRPTSPDPSSPGWPSIFAYGRYVATTLPGKEFVSVGQPAVGHDWSPELADQAVAFMNRHSGIAAPDAPGDCSKTAGADGFYCGNDAPAKGSPGTLYHCVSGKSVKSDQVACPRGCQRNGGDQDDACN